MLQTYVFLLYFEFGGALFYIVTLATCVLLVFLVF